MGSSSPRHTQEPSLEVDFVGLHAILGQNRSALARAPDVDEDSRDALDLGGAASARDGAARARRQKAVNAAADDAGEDSRDGA